MRIRETYDNNTIGMPESIEIIPFDTIYVQEEVMFSKVPETERFEWRTLHFLIIYSNRREMGTLHCSSPNTDTYWFTRCLFFLLDNT